MVIIATKPTKKGSEVQGSTFRVEKNPNSTYQTVVTFELLYETTPKWHGFLIINLVVLADGLNSEPQNIE